METNAQEITPSTLTSAELFRLKLPVAANEAEFLTKLALQRGMAEPVFEEVSESGPPHMKTFVWHCTFNDLVSQGIGPSKKQAKLAAAKAIKDALDYGSLPPVKPVKPVENEVLRKRTAPSDATLDNATKKQKKPNAFGSGFGKSLDSQLRKTPSLMDPIKGGINNAGMGFASFNQRGFPASGIPSGVGFGLQQAQTFNSFQNRQSVNQFPIGLGSMQSMSPLHRLPQANSSFQQMTYPNYMPFMQMSPYISPGMLGNFGLGSVNPLICSGAFGTNMQLMGFTGDFGMVNYAPGFTGNSTQKKEISSILPYNPYNPYVYEQGSVKTNELDKINKAEFMRPSFGSFHSNEAAGPSLKDHPSIAKERTYLSQQLQLRQNSHHIPVQSKLDKIVLQKHKELCPNENELKFILKLVCDTEKTLKKVAEQLNKLANQPLKTIEGMLRVGDLSKGLLMAGDRAVNLLLMCKYTPSISLLRDIQQVVTEKLKEVAPENEYKIYIFEEEAGFCVVAMPPNANTNGKADEPELQEEDLPFAVNVSLTSMSMSETKDGNSNDKEIKVNDIADPLPKEKCALALSEMRHSKWFSVTAAKLSSCVECIRIVKDISNRDPIWNVLPDWAIEVMVERAAFTAWIPLNIGNLLKRVMEMIASGILISNDIGIKDPCEINDVDVMADLTPQQKEDLTKSAQRFLRMINFNKVYEVLGLDPPNIAEVSVHEATVTEKVIEKVEEVPEKEENISGNEKEVTEHNHDKEVTPGIDNNTNIPETEKEVVVCDNEEDVIFCPMEMEEKK